MICPHCLVAFSDNPTYLAVGSDVDGRWNLLIRACPECNRFILHLETDTNPSLSQEKAQIGAPFGGWFGIENPKTVMVRPKGSSRPPCPAEVPEKIKKDYLEACLVLSDSPNASAALSRRCLQHVLRDHAKVTPDNLGVEITEVKERGNLPSGIAKVIRAPQELCNIAAHPMPDTAGEIVDVEPWEAEWVLDILEMLFDYYFVQPAEAARRMNAIHTKYEEARRNV